MSERLPRPPLRSAFRAQLREELLREAPSALAPVRRRDLVPWPRIATWWRPLAAALVVALLVVATNSAAAESLPGEPPFEIKRTAEEVRLLAANTRAVRLQALGEQADGRLAELRRANAQRKPAVAAEAARRLGDALERLATEVVRARADVARVRVAEHQVAVRKVETLAEAQGAAIAALLPGAPAPTRAFLERAAEQARRIRSR